jgi:hypothetical protein
MSQHELHFPLPRDAQRDHEAAVEDAAAEVFALRDDQGDALWLGVDPAAGRPVLLPDQLSALVELRVVRRKLGGGLALLAHGHDILVDGLPALALTVLNPRDSVVLAPGAAVGYVTERLKPYIGPPTVEMIAKKQKCPYCRIPFSETPNSRVVTCRCSATVHHEDEHSHPDTPQKDRLECLSKIKACLSCNRPIALTESLVFDPSNW